MRSDKSLAIKLRLTGKSYKQIGDALDIPKSTLSTWLKDINISEEAKIKIQSRARKFSIEKLILRNVKQTQIAQDRHQTIKKRAEQESLTLLNEPLFIAGASLYWAEGYKKGWEKSKWKCIDFANSDPKMIKVMLLFFKKYLNIKEKDIKVQIMGHENNAIEKYINFWHNLTGVPTENFFKPHLAANKSSTKKTKTNLEYGTIHLRIYNIEKFFRLSGWIETLKTKFI